MTIMTDGYKTTIAFGTTGALTTMDEREVTPPAIAGGGAIDTTSMANTAWRTRFPKQLKTLTEASVTIVYDPAVYTSFTGAINVNQEITITFPDTSTLVFWGWIDEFSPGANAEGEQPTADLTIICSNMNGSNAEIAPAYTGA